MVSSNGPPSIYMCRSILGWLGMNPNSTVLNGRILQQRKCIIESCVGYNSEDESHKYQSWWAKSIFNRVTKLCVACSQVINLKTISTNWTNERLTCKHLPQIRATLHLKDGVSDIGHKCHQLHVAIWYWNDHTQNTFILSHKCSLDEGVIVSKSRYNPILSTVPATPFLSAQLPEINIFHRHQCLHC